MYSSLANLFKDSQATSDDINLLLLGETGVGKSTLINSISNYLNYPDFKEAQKGNIDILIPMCLNVADVSKVFGNLDDNELLEDGKSATQHVKLYLFPIKLGSQTFKLRLIDTPGVGDPRGTDQDNVNLDNILAYLATLKKLHAICFVLKSNQTRFTKFVEYCLKQILTRLDKSASRNIIFITTYSKAAGYTAGETKTNCLMPLVNDIQSRPPHVSIPLSDSNIFALDNEGFKALLAIQEGKKYSKHELDGFVYSWEVSSKEIHRLLAYIIGDIENAALNPHDVENTISINEVRFLVEQLTTPIAEVSALLQDNIRILDRHKKSLSEEDQTLEQLKKQLHIPCVDLKVKNLTQPVTVCTDAKCADVVKVKQITQWHYKQRCHNPCLLNGIPREMIGDPGLINCDAMAGKETCQQCGCHWKLHMHIYKETEKVQTQQEDQHVKNQIQTKQDARVQIQKLMKDINTRMTELEAESETISKIVAKFSYFLQEHALTPFNDAYSDYIEQLLKNERYLGKFADQDVITKLEKLLTRHQHLQKIFQNGAKNVQAGETSNDLRLQGIKDSISELYTLKHMGKKIQELIEKSSTCRQKETQKNFSCKVAQEIVLDKKIAEEENESLYVPSYSVIYTFKSDDLEDDRSATPTTNFRLSGDSSRNPKGFKNHQEPNSMQHARRSSSQNRFDHSRGYDIEYSGTRPTTQHSRNSDRMSTIVNTTKCVKIPKIFLLVNHTEDTIEWTIHLDVTVAVAKAMIQMVVIPLHLLAAEEASKTRLGIATTEAIIIPITLFLENRPEGTTLTKVAILGTKTNPTLKAVLQIDRLTAEVALKCLGTEEAIRSPVVQNISLLVVREMQKRTTIQELKRSRNIDHTKTHLGLIAVEAKVKITVQVRVLLAKTRLDNLGTKEGLNLLVKTTIQRMIVLLRLPKAVIGNTANLVSLMNVRNRMIHNLEKDVVRKKKNLEVGRIQSKGSENRWIW
ncbi:hypothetical protein Zmor_015094 [Zophobas morio]|uniref:DUF8206 domain-containing protein n=1 Tax=Zophobas morio TaxID=2755281 RepID=A0AA38MH95_9CUCU|nr:hypothetical protein Zmor_015094 [Zophobas morio]